MLISSQGWPRITLGMADGASGRPPAASLKVSLPAWWSWIAALPPCRCMACGILGKRADEIVAPDAELVGESLAARSYSGHLGNDKASAAFCPPGQVLNETIARCIVHVCISRTHGRHDRPVLELHGADRDGRKQMYYSSRVYSFSSSCGLFNIHVLRMNSGGRASSKVMASTGQASTQLPHPIHFFSSIMAVSSMLIASNEHLSSHAPQPVQMSASTLARNREGAKEAS